MATRLETDPQCPAASAGRDAAAQVREIDLLESLAYARAFAAAIEERLLDGAETPTGGASPWNGLPGDGF